MTVTPISPEEVHELKQQLLPDEVIRVWNQLIAENFRGSISVIYQDEALARLETALDCSRDTVFKKGYLEIEDIYRKVGWTVKYDKPGYNEDYRAFFRFTKV